MSKLLIFMVVFLQHGGQTIDPYLELGRIEHAMLQMDNLMKYSMQMNYYEGLQSSTPSEKLKINLIRKGNNLYIYSDFFEILAYDQDYLLVDSEKKAIYLSERAADNFDLFTKFVEQAKSFEQLRATCKSQGGKGVIVLSAPELSGSKYEIVYDRKSFLVESITMEVDLDDSTIENNKTRTVTKFFDYEISNDPFPLRTTDFIRKNGGKLKPTMRYKKYSIVNNKNKKR